MNRRHTVLVVDDESDVVASVKDLLRLDYKVLGATRAADGLAMLDREPVHVVMTDQRMPEITGVELLQKDLPQPLAGYLKRMHAAGQRLQYLIDQIVGMLAAQQFERRPELKPTDLGQLVRRAIDDVRPFAEVRGQTLRLDLPENPGVIE